MTQTTNAFGEHIANPGHCVRLESNGVQLITGTRQGMTHEKWIGDCRNVCDRLALPEMHLFRAVNWDVYAVLKLPNPYGGLLGAKAYFWIMADIVGEFDDSAASERWLIQYLTSGSYASWATTHIEMREYFHEAARLTAGIDVRGRVEGGPPIPLDVNLRRVQAATARTMLETWYNKWYQVMEQQAQATIALLDPGIVLG